MSCEPAIRLRGLSKCYRLYASPRDRLKQALLSRLPAWAVRGGGRNYCREFWALRDIGFVVERGETVGIIGRNGSGKSTLLQLICGTLAPTAGEMQVKGRVAALLELGAGFNPEFSGRENVYMSASILGLERAEIDRRFPDIAVFAEIGEFIERPVKIYSSGMYVRLAFAVIAHVDADILVIDEALAVGDALFTQKCMRFLRDFQKRGSLLFVSHDTSAVINLCQRALWLEEGRMRMVGSAKDVCEAYLATMFESPQGQGPAEQGKKSPLAASARTPAKARTDQRQRYLNRSSLRNDIEIFEFDPSGNAFGLGGGEIVEVQLLDELRRPLAWMVGGEEVTLVIRAQAREHLRRPIIGFYFKDRLGQFLFGDNTFLPYRDRPVAAAAGDIVEARFRFHLPVLPAGDYSVCVALADGTQQEHVQHQWIHDALMLKSHTSSVITGLVGLPMEQISLEVASSSRQAEGQ